MNNDEVDRFLRTLTTLLKCFYGSVAAQSVFSPTVSRKKIKLTSNFKEATTFEEGLLNASSRPNSDVGLQAYSI